MNAPNSEFLNKQLSFLNSQIERFKDEEDIKLGDISFDGAYYNVEVLCNNKDLVPLLDIKMINFQFAHTASYKEVLLKVTTKRGLNG